MAVDEYKLIAKFTDISGKKSGKLTASKYIGHKKHRPHWECVCECGGLKIVEMHNFLKRTVKSCGCVRKNETHGMCYTKEYQVWFAMRKRCTDPERGGHQRYGGRGILVCQRWQDSFVKFIDDMGPRPSPNHSIDRIDNNGNYEPSNCRWATLEEQATNKETTIFVDVFGETLTLVDAVKKWGAVSYARTIDRIYEGWGHERALYTPVLNWNHLQKVWNRKVVNAD